MLESKRIVHRLRPLATDWTTYLVLLSFLGTLLEVITGIFNELATLLTAFHGSPRVARYVTVTSLAIVTMTLLFDALFTRRSILRMPDRFLVSIDDPRYLVEREDYIKVLTDECEHATPPFLIGESEVGKSALVQAGLRPQMHTPMTPSHGANRILRLLLDASFLGWQHGLRNAVTTALHTLSADEPS